MYLGMWVKNDMYRGHHVALEFVRNYVRYKLPTAHT